jgi:hypothetical protein
MYSRLIPPLSFWIDQRSLLHDCLFPYQRQMMGTLPYRTTHNVPYGWSMPLPASDF